MRAPVLAGVRRRALSLLLPTLLLAISAIGQSQGFKTIVVFGDSLSDTGNVAHQTQHYYGIRIPGTIADYTDGRFTDGFDTQPASALYRGVWIEQLAAALPYHPSVKNSLDGGTDYAFGFATTGPGPGAFTFGPGDIYSVPIENIGLQITDFLAKSPKITHKILFVVWGGAIDVLYSKTPADVVAAAIRQAANVQSLIDAGATDIIVPNLPPLGSTPRLNVYPATISGYYTQLTQLYNGTLATALDHLAIPPRHADDEAEHEDAGDVDIYRLDIFSLFNKVIAAPASYGLTNVKDSSQAKPGVNPDKYLFWDDLHPTTHVHDIIAFAAAQLLNDDKCWADSWPYVVSPAQDHCSEH
ncbi:MAG: SGNH/GDSL hydrolase family protein [Acidobacteriaceae bacterium]